MAISVLQVAFNSSFGLAVRSGIGSAQSLLDDSVLLVSWLVNNASFTELVDACTATGAALIRGAIERNRNRNLDALLDGGVSNATNASEEEEEVTLISWLPRDLTVLDLLEEEVEEDVEELVDVELLSKDRE